MSVGLKDKGKGIFLFLRVLPNKKISIFPLDKPAMGRADCLFPEKNSNRRKSNLFSGFTFVEVLMATLILIIVIGALITTLSTGEFSNSVGSVKADLQSNVRIVMDWIVKDVRQTSLIQINSNNPTANHIKFKQITGIDNSTGNYTLSSDYVEYTYDNVLNKITRSVVDDSGAILRTWEFSSIIQPPFYTDAGVPLVADAILASKKLLVIISGQSNVKGSIDVNFSLTEEVRIRNE